MTAEPIEHDVFICFSEPAGRDLAAFVSAGLVKRRFRVIDGAGKAGAAPPASRLDLIEEAPDFVVLLTPGCLDVGATSGDRLRAEISHALKTERNVVPVFAPGFVRHPTTPFPPDVAPLMKLEGVPFSPGSPAESVARIAHMLASDTTVDERHTMREAKVITWTISSALVGIMVFAIVQALPRMLARSIEPPPIAPIQLHWCGFGQRFEDGRWVERPVQDGTEVAPGDQVRVAFTLNGDGYAYVLSRDLRGDVAVLFPALTINAQAGVRAGEMQTAPVDTGWLTIDGQTGLQALYIVASYDPIENLESMVEEREDSATASARVSMLETTIMGLVDGKHVSPLRGVRTRRLALIDRTLAGPPTVRTATVTLASGDRVTRELTAQQGLVSALAEIRVQFVGTR